MTADRGANGLLTIEGDIQVVASDQWCHEPDVTSNSTANIATAEQALGTKGANYQWPNGVVPYEIDASIGSYQTKLLNSLSDLEKAVGPGLHFRPKTANDTSWIAFVLDPTGTAGCNSPVGRVGGRQILQAQISSDGSDCVGNKHEIMHALGAIHEQTRRDRDQYLNVYYNRMRGCTSTATSLLDCGHSVCASRLADCGCTAATDADGTCYSWPSQSGRDDNSQLVGTYDYGSTMHYRGCIDPKVAGQCEIEANRIDPATGNPYAFGDVWEPSVGDIIGLRTMYPVASVQPVVFASTGIQQVCALEGRENDRGTWSSISGLSIAPATCSFDTTGLTQGDHSVSVTIRNQFATRGYDYPNYSIAYDSARSYEEYKLSANIAVLDPGLLAIFTQS